MTNFQGSSTNQKGWITPERAVLVLPVLGGVVLAGLVMAFVFGPLVYQVQQRSAAVQELENKKAALPLLRAQLSSLLQRLELSRTQQNRLLHLVAGGGQLKTWLAQLNRLATQKGVIILSIEPQPIQRGGSKPATEPLSPASPASGAPPAVKTPSPPTDRLLAPNLEKHSALIVVQAPFPNLKAFLQDLELLEVIALGSDLELESIASPVAAPITNGTSPSPVTATSKGPAMTKLKMLISFYGRIGPVSPTSAVP